MSVQPAGAPPAGAPAIIEAGRQRQVSIATQATAAFVAAWAQFEAALAAGGSLAPWFTVVDDLAGAFGEAAFLSSWRTYRELRELRYPGESMPGLPTRRTNLAAVNGSLRSLVVGPISRDRSPEARVRARTAAAGAFVRHTLAPGRDLVHAAVDDARAATPRRPAADRRLLGWGRATDGDPCSWCAMLASRVVRADDGSRALYSSREVALFDEHGDSYHDHCTCTAYPVFSDDPVSPQARWFRSMWNAAAAGDDDQLNAFRRSVEAQRRQHGDLAVAFAQRSS